MHILIIFVIMCHNNTQPHFIRLAEGNSSNTIMSQRAATLNHGDVITLHNQTAGRGQRGNSWEAEPGCNITLSLFLKPRGIKPNQQFFISEIVSLAIVQWLDSYLDNTPHSVAIKWPNDIYVDDLKICGILIEHAITSSCISHTIAGIGLNVNQTVFVSDAPNPVSLANLTSGQYKLPLLDTQLCAHILQLMDMYDNPAMFDELHRLYRSRLWRREGTHTYRDTATGSLFTAAISDVLPTGHLLLTEPSGHTRTYAFKEVTAIL